MLETPQHWCLGSNAKARQADPGDSLDSQSIEMASSRFSKRACLKNQGGECETKIGISIASHMYIHILIPTTLLNKSTLLVTEEEMTGVCF